MRLTSAQHLELAAQIHEDQGPACIIPGCPNPWTDKAHITPSGSGGRPSTYDPDNLVGLCHEHHMIFDGHQLQGRQLMLRCLMRSRADHIRNCGRGSFSTPRGV